MKLMRSQRMVVGAVVASAFWLANACGSPAAVPSARSPYATLTAPSPSLNPSPSIQIPPIPEGTYEVNVTRKDFARVGYCGDPNVVNENTGHIILTFRNGRFRWGISANHPIFHTLFTGTYSGTGHRVVLTYDPNTADEGVNTLRWAFDGKYLKLTPLRALPDLPDVNHLCAARVQYGSHSWLKTG